MKRTIVLLVSLALALPGLGCKKGGGTASTPEEMGPLIVAALNSHDAAAVGALFPPDEVFAAAFDCGGRENFAIEHVKRARARLVAELSDDLKDVTLSFLGVDTEREIKKKTLAVGEEEDGCTAKQPLTMVKIRFKFEMKKGDKTETEGEGVSLVQIGEGGPWYLFKF